MKEKKHVCPWWLCYTFDNPFRKWFHNPELILGPYVHPGDHAIDIGAGMGFFTIALAKLVGPSGRVTAVDIQPQMLSGLTRRAQRAGVAERINPYLADPGSLGEHPPADFVLAFWMVHEVPDQKAFIREIAGMLKPGGRFLLSEPKMHVSEGSFLRTLETAREAGFIRKDNPKIRVSRSVLLAVDRNA